MNLLLFADTHGSHRSANILKKACSERAVDCIILAGDFSNFGKFHESLLEIIADSKIPCTFTSGNHESPYLCQQLAEACENLHYIDYRSIVLGGLELFGIAGWDIFDLKRKENIYAFSGSIPAHSGSNLPRILITHEPPFPWTHQGKKSGDKWVAQAVEIISPDLVVCGHLHEQQASQQKTSTGIPIINPGATGVLAKIERTEDFLGIDFVTLDSS